MLLQVIKFKSALSEEELLKVAHEREPLFAAIPGIVQKYYFKTSTPGEYGGLYVWDSPDSLQEYRESALAASIGSAYEVTGVPDIQFMDVLFQLRH
jgi:heme-degrading monooxygenase HmoA